MRRACKVLIQIIPLGIALAAVIYGVVGWASADTGGPPIRGEMVSSVNGYRVSEIRFQLANDPGQMELVEFNLDGDAVQVQVKIPGSRSGAYICSEVVDQHWHCPLQGVSVGAVEEIVISALSG